MEGMGCGFFTSSCGLRQFPARESSGSTMSAPTVIKSNLKIARVLKPLVIQGFSNFLGLFQVMKWQSPQVVDETGLGESRNGSTGLKVVNPLCSNPFYKYSFGVRFGYLDSF